MRIRFTSDQVYESEGPNRGPRFVKGEIIDASADFAGRWIRRGVAEPVEGEHPAPKGGVRYERVSKPEPVEAAEPIAGSVAVPDRVEKRGVYWFAMTGEIRTPGFDKMTTAEAIAFAAAHSLKAPPAPRGDKKAKA